ncbi:MAG: hypothetical protein QNL90_15205 [Gammaproteobacteria bacterium]|nr:hypothetical protein [Gammaproteobacteria bacterium]MDX2461492.1 hypothetical protein [Gammaproteobacteria bacterium]
MIGLLLLLSALTLLGAFVAWRRRRDAAQIGFSRPVSASVSHEDLLPESGDGDNGLATFYAYQMAVGRIHRH